MTKTRYRVWIWYAAGWIPLGLFYAVLMSRTRFMSVGDAIESGLAYVLPVAVMGVGIWHTTAKLTWPPASRASFFAKHVGLAVLFSILWVGVEISLIATGTGFSTALGIARPWAGFQALDGLFFYGLIAAGSYLIRIVSRLREQEARAAGADALRMRAELAALRGQLNPHFLFNTLHTLTALVRRDPDTAEHALERFGDMLRYVLDVKRSAREDVTLGDEMQFVRNYLSLEQLRLGDRLTVVERIDPEALDCVVPSLTLQPLVENAIKYGIAPRAKGGRIEIGAFFQGQTLVLEVRDDGPGAATDILDSANGVGLRAVRQRLDTRYETLARFGVTTAPGEGFIVRIQLPAHSGAVVLPPAPARV
jgi:sensor histidine kinase YesM